MRKLSKSCESTFPEPRIYSVSIIILALLLLSFFAAARGAEAASGNSRGARDALAGSTLRVTGPPEIVFDWSTDRCADDDIPDLPARAFRDARGQVQLIATHTIARRYIGRQLDRLRRECRPVFVSERDADPASFNDAEWIAAVYTEDGETVHAIIHNEYHGWEHPGRCAAPDNFSCWYNTLTLARSTDRGWSYHHPVTPPDHLIATLPYQYEDSAGPYGIFSPSNIIRGPGGAYYAFIKVDDYRSPSQWVCLMRTRDLSDPRSWRFWNGRGKRFDGRFVNPYTDRFKKLDKHVCKPVDPASIGAQMVESVTYNTYLKGYVLIGISADTLDGREVWGFYYSFSTDLINWTRRKLLLEVDFPWTVANPADIHYLYPSLLDPRSRSRNFETTGRTAYLYYMRNNGGLEPSSMDLDRDLIRVPVEFETP